MLMTNILLMILILLFVLHGLAIENYIKQINESLQKIRKKDNNEIN